MEKLCAVLLLAAAVSVAEGSKMQMPSFATAGDKVEIECKLDHDKYVIEHVKWYKDNQLFYNIIQANEPSNTKFDLYGVNINMDESKMDRVILNAVNEESSGIYTCELKLEDGMARMSGTLTVYPAKEKSQA